MQETVAQKRLELILQQLEQLPTLPAVAMRVVELTSDQRSEVDEIVRLISSDQSLATRILQLLHRADLGVREDVTDLHRAVVLLGFDAVRSAVLAVSVFQTFREGKAVADKRFSREEFWKHAVAVACCAELLAVELSHEKPSLHMQPSQAMLCGLLHDIGKVALDALLPKSFEKVLEGAEVLHGDVSELERQVIGIDHLLAGKRLAERWRLPAVVRDCIWLHGQHPAALPPSVVNPALVNITTLADQMVREQHLGFSGNYSFAVPNTTLVEAIGLDEKHLHKVRQDMLEQIEPRAKALGLDGASSGALFSEALARAHEELGRVSSQLALKNRKLVNRAKMFESLSDFTASLSPDAPTRQVLAAIGDAAAHLMDTPAAAFAVLPGQNHVEVEIRGMGQVAVESLVLEAPGNAVLPQASEPDFRNPTGELEWLCGPLAPRLGGARQLLLLLSSDAITIGGVLWGGDEALKDRANEQTQDLRSIAASWSLALRTSQVREEARVLAEQLAQANRSLQATQQELWRSRMLGTVGELAAGAAHEMNNPLAIISGRSQLLAGELPEGRHQAAAATIAEQSQRLSDMITQLMDFAKPTAPKPEVVHVAEIVDQALAEAKQGVEAADRTIEVVGESPPPMLVDKQQISWALSAVIENALQATEAETGLVRIVARSDHSQRQVVISVYDNGCGMDEATLKRAFDPFFSSKPAGRRRGMGLARALRWVESNGGAMRLDSRLTEGTTAFLLLPAANGHLPVVSA